MECVERPEHAYSHSRFCPNNRNATVIESFSKRLKNVFLLTIPKKNSKIIELQRHLINMSFNKDSAITKARQDLAKRLKIKETDIKAASVSEKDFPDMSLGAPAKDEMSGQMISSGWQIKLSAGGKDYEYRADKYQLRLKNFNGTNHVIES